MKNIQLVMTGHCISLVDIATNAFVRTFIVNENIQKTILKYIYDNNLVPNESSFASFPWLDRLADMSTKKLYSIQWKDMNKRVLEVLCDDCLKRIQANPAYYGCQSMYVFREKVSGAYTCDSCGR